ncbi:MAG: succinylglutamate desuccinylase/aspartoacylase family protein [Candidatus Cloacimonetes bacterium]|nr:succinylglutamate desuccinylase/aspartoacylase family protein [Candidatus Cloacimonadota bacterium]
MKKKLSNLKIGRVGTVDINIPLITIGVGKPKVLLLVGIHGNEISGLFVVQKLLEKLKLKAGGLNIITAANPLAQALRKRETPLDLRDLNRNFPGNKDRSFTDRLATKIFAEAKKCDLVIDLHTFEDSSPVVAIFMNHGSNKVKKASLKFIKALQPDIIWRLSTQTEEEKRLSGSLGPKLAEIGITNFAIEMPECFRITEEQLERIVMGLLNVFSLLGMIDEKTGSWQDKIPIFERQQVHADRSGLFIPQKKLMEKVKNSEVVAEMISIKNFASSKIKSPFAGQLIVFKEKDLVNTGDTLFTIGKRVGEL